MADRAVLAGGVQGLEDHEHAVHVLCRQPVLVVRQQGHPLLEQVHAVVLVQEVRLVARIEVLREVDRVAGRHPQPFDERCDLVRLLVRHGGLLRVPTSDSARR